MIESADAQLGKQQFCNALDLSLAGCSALQNLQHSPDNLSWTVVRGTSVFGGSSLQVPTTVPSGEQSCLNLALNIDVGHSIQFYWRNNATADSNLVFLVDNRVVRVLPGMDDDGIWTDFSWVVRGSTATTSISWCYQQGAVLPEFDPQRQAWLDLLTFGPLVAISSVSTPVRTLSRNHGREQVYRFEVAVNAVDQSSIPAEYDLGLRATGRFAESVTALTVERQTSDNGTLLLLANLQVDWFSMHTEIPLQLHPVGLPEALSDGFEVGVSVPLQQVRTIFCEVLELSAGDCNLIDSISTTPEYPWQVTGYRDLFNLSLQSDPASIDRSQSVLTVTLSQPVSGVEFFRQVSSEPDFDWLIFEYDDVRRGTDQFSSLEYELLLFTDGNDQPVAGDISGMSAGYSLLRLQSDQRLLSIREIRWIYLKDSRDLLGDDRGWIDQLRFYRNESLSNLQQLCDNLDLNTENCRLLRSFSQAESTTQWMVNKESDTLQIFDRERDGAPVCLDLAVNIQAGDTIQFSWHLFAARGTSLSFMADGAVVRELAATGVEMPWVRATWRAPEALDSIGWCYIPDPSQNAADLVGQAEVDALVIGPLVAVTSVSTPTLIAGLSREQILTYHFEFAIESTDRRLAEGQYDIGLRLTGNFAENIVTLRIGTQTVTADGLVFSAVLQLNWVRMHAAELTWQLQLTGPPVMVSEGSAVVVTVPAEQVKAIFCSVMELNERDCSLIDNIDTSPQYPWQVTDYRVFRGLSLQSDPARVDDTQSILELTLLEPVAGMEFYHQVSSEDYVDRLFVEVNDVRVDSLAYMELPFTDAEGEEARPEISGTVPYTLLRLNRDGSTGFIRLIRWVFEKDGSLSLGDDRGWIDRLRFLRRESVMELQQLCAALDVSDRSCSLLQSFSQDQTALQWDIVNIEAYKGDTALQIIGREGDQGLSCLNLGVNIDRGDSVQFYWRLDAGILTFLAAGALVYEHSDAEDRESWVGVSWTAEAAVSTLSWCYISAPSDSPQRAWLDKLTFGPLVAITSISTPQQIQEQSQGQRVAYRFDVTIQVGNRSLMPDDYDIGLSITGSLADQIVAVTVTTRTLVDDTLIFSTQLQLDWASMHTTIPWRLQLVGLPVAHSQGVEFAVTASAELVKRVFCEVLELTADDCERIENISTTPQYPWQVSAYRAFSGQSLQSSPNSIDASSSVLTVTLRQPVLGVDFYRQVSSERAFDRLLFEFNDRIFDSRAYREIPFTDSTGLRIRGDSSELDDGYSLLRLLSDGELLHISQLRFIYSKDDTRTEGDDRAWIDQLRFFRNNAVMNINHLCLALDISDSDCEQLESFTQTRSTRNWTIGNGESYRGDSALNILYTQEESNPACLMLRVNWVAGQGVEFYWRADAARGSRLNFIIDDTVIESLYGTGSDTGWNRISWSATGSVAELGWCYADSASEPVTDTLKRVWVDALRVTDPEFTIWIAAVSTPMLTAIDNGGRQESYSFAVILNARNVELIPGQYDIGLGLAEENAGIVKALTVTTQTAMAGGVSLAVSMQLDLRELVDTVALQLHLSGVPTTASGFVRLVDVSEQAQQLICTVLEMEMADCALLNDYSTTSDYPWQVTATTFDGGGNLLASGSDLADGTASCLTLELLLPAGSRIDFLWAVDSAPGDVLSLLINNEPIAAISGLRSAVPAHAQQRFAATAVSSLQWCYRKDDSGSDGDDWGFLGQLNLLQPEAAILLPGRDELCRALDASIADCAAVMDFGQMPLSLSWSLDESVYTAGGSSLQSPVTVADAEMACLTLTLSLPADTAVAFDWRVDSSAQSAFDFRINDELRVSISGPADRIGWSRQRHISELPVSSLSWCFSRTAGNFAGTERAWLDQLSLEPLGQGSPIHPVISLISSVSSSVADAPYQFDIRLRSATGTEELPTGISVLVLALHNLSEVTLTTLATTAMSIDYRVMATARTASELARLRLAPSILPTALEPEQAGFSITLTPAVLTEVVPILKQLTDERRLTPGISLSDLLLGLRLFNEAGGASSLPILDNLAVSNTDLTADMQNFMALINDPEQRAVVDVDRNGIVNEYDFRLMVRYHSGLRGKLLCDEACETRIRLLLSQ